MFCLSPYRFGMHEDYDYYVNCKLRQRNMGLFTADQVSVQLTVLYSSGCCMWVWEELQQYRCPSPIPFHRT